MAYQYKGYNPANVKHVQKYEREHYHNVILRFDKAYYDDQLKPLADKMGVPVATLVKQAVTEFLVNHG